jgi:glycosyltransferase involved in cell wall biosynthesis
VPTHISEPPFLAETLASVVAQERANWEVIVVDDGSPDAGALVELAAVDRRIRVVRQDRGGVARARNFGLEHARGELVAFLDYDDLWYPGHLSSTVDALAAHADAVGAFTAFDVVTGADKEHRRVMRAVGPTTRRSVYSGGNRPWINTLVARRDAVAGVGGFDPAFDGADDLDLVHKLAERGRFVYVDEVTAAYRLHDHNWSRDTRGLASAGDRVLAAHLNRVRTAGDADAAAGLAVSRRGARRYYSERAVRDASDASKCGDIRLCAALLWWAVRFSPRGAATVLVQGTVRRLSSRGPGRCPR